MSGNRIRGAHARQVRRALSALLGAAVRALWGRRKLAAVGIALVVAAFVVRAGVRAVLSSPYFRVRTVDVSPSPHLDRGTILEAVGLSEDRAVNIFRFDASAAEEALRANPWVATAEVTTTLPGAVHIRVAERTPAGVVVLSGLYLTDAAGRLFTRPTPAEAARLPLITGLTRAGHDAEPEAFAVRVREALALARLYAQSPLAVVRPLSDVHVAAGSRMELMLGRTRVALGRGGFGEKLVRLNLLLSSLRERRRDAAYILMDDDGRRAVVKEAPLEDPPPGSLSMRWGREQGGNE